MSFELHGTAAMIFIGVVTVIFLVVTFSPVLIAIVISAIVRQRAAQYCQKRAQTIVAQYDPPENLLPAEVGYLYDTRLNDREYIATLLSLEARHIIRLNDEHSLTVVDEARLAACATFEQRTVASYGKSIALSPGKALPINRPRAELASQLRDSLIQKGYLLDRRTALKQLALRLVIIVVISLLWWIFIGWNFDNNLSYGDGPVHHVPARTLEALLVSATATMAGLVVLWPAYIGLAYIIERTLEKRIGAYWIGTKKLRDLWPELEGYRLFLRQTDLGQLQQQMNTAQLSTTHAALLPYAIVLNLPIRWESYLSSRFHAASATPRPSDDETKNSQTNG